MTNEMIKEIGETMVTKMNLINRVKRTGEYKDNMRKCPWYSEFYGMIQMLKIMNVNYDIDWNEDITEMIAITLNGQRFDLYRH